MGFRRACVQIQSEHIHFACLGVHVCVSRLLPFLSHELFLVQPTATALALTAYDFRWFLPFYQLDSRLHCSVGVASS